MKVRIGGGVGTVTGPSSGPEAVTSRAFTELVTAMSDFGFDSIWLPEILTAPTLDPLTALAFAAGRHPGLKLGTTMLLPGRNVLRLAKELATLDRLSDGRLLVTLVPGIPRSAEASATGVPPPARGRLMDEMLPLLRRLWAGETVSYDGSAGLIDGVRLEPRPLQDPLEVWTGGIAPAALERCGCLADGWLPSACTPAEVAEGRQVVEAAAARAGRAISPEHFGVSIGYSMAPLDEATLRLLSSLRRRGDPAAVVPVGYDGLRATLEEFLDVGFSKFVLRPIQPPASWPEELERLAGAVLDLQT
ncbi:MAG: LLM class flavin-dependent oxidoreductase [Acidimicrobiales bacterium]|nr:LLM class flavin-dependent oxidoreductase [Acidimicrobiales bacterium]